VDSFTSRQLYPGWPFDRRLDGHQNRSERRGEEKNLLLIRTRDSTSDPSAAQPVASRYTDYAIPVLKGKSNINVAIINVRRFTKNEKGKEE
jgi:hypothetical protein